MKLKMASAFAAFLLSTVAGNAEGVLNIYNWGNYTSPEMIKKFEKEFDVKVTITDYNSNDTALAKVRQGGHGFDVVVPSQNYIPIWISEGLLLESRPDQMANFKNVKDDYANPSYDPDRHYTVPWGTSSVGISVNTSIYKGPLEGWGLVFNPPEELKGKINIIPEMNDVIDSAVIYAGGKPCTNDLSVLKKVRDTLVTAKPFWAAMDYGTVAKMSAGDYAATTEWSGSAMRERLKNPDIHFVYPKEGFLTGGEGAAILKDAQNVENAKLFLNFLMDPENAGMNSGFHRFGSGIKDAEKFMPDDMKGAPELDLPADLRPLSIDARVCPQDVQELYTKIWT